MLGKGLESLIPQKGNANGNGNGGANGNGNTNSDEHHQPALPPREPESALPPQEPEPAFPAAVPAVAPATPPATSTPARVEPRADQRPRQEPARAESVFHIEVEKIKPNSSQPRRSFDDAALRDLASSIREFGFLQPLVVSKIEKETPNGIEVEYELIAGERRLMAAKLLGLAMAPAIIRNVNLEREKLELAVIENIQRENLNPIETARAFQRLQEEFRMTQREIAAKLGKSRETVANTVRLLDLPENIRVAVEKHELSESHARLLLAIQDQAAQQHLFEDIIREHLTTRDLKERVDRMTDAAARDAAEAGGAVGASGMALHRRGRPPKTDDHLPPELRALQDSLSMDLGAPVEIYKGQAKGSITITFYSEEELRAIMQRLGKEDL